MYKIIDNFLTDDEYLPLKKLLESDTFPWYFQNNSIVYLNRKNIFHLAHNFYKEDDGGHITSNHFDLIKPLIAKLKVKSLIRVMAILKTLDSKIIKGDYHKDQPYDCNVALYYINTTNGYTKIGKDKVDCVQNRMVLFNSSVEHYATNCTNHKQRISININYF
jgi:hypothetical protein